MTESHDSHSDAESVQDWSDEEEKALVQESGLSWDVKVGVEYWEGVSIGRQFPPGQMQIIDSGFMVRI